MSTPHERRASLRPAVLFAACLSPLAGHCDHDEYPLQATFCDDWCRVILRPGCDQEPENCVRECEASVAQGACFEGQVALLRCYEASDVSDWACFESGFQEISRPREPICRTERDSLIECAYPTVRRCLELCRSIQMSLELDASALPTSRTCPSPDIPCDSMCWALQGVLGSADSPAPRIDSGKLSNPAVGTDASARAAASAATDASFGPDSTSSHGSAAPDATIDGDLTMRLFHCAADRAAQCYAADAAADLDAAALSGANWTSVSRDCARELGLL